ncbi:MAG: aminotransferase class IV [Planctomycetia bacterium]|nr:aminotransferase class IV [Planctomycetia bacterium]
MSLSPAIESAWLSGQLIPRTELTLSVGDMGFVLGTAVTEQLRTFGGRLFLSDAHRNRLRRSLEICGIDPGIPLVTVFLAAAEVAHHNHALLSNMRGDLGVIVFVTPGDHPSQHGGNGSPPRVAIHTFPLAFQAWKHLYRAGVKLRSVSIQQVPSTSWPIELKCRSRMHYFLADREASQLEPGARAIICHSDGRVSETSTANLLIVRGSRLLTPSPQDALPGVSLEFVRLLAQEHSMPLESRSLSIEDVADADEVLLLSTPSCLLPVVSLNGRPIGAGHPGPMCEKLISLWSNSVGLDIVMQAMDSEFFP